MALGNLKVTLELVADQFVSTTKMVQNELAGLGRTITSPEFARGAEVVGASFIAMGTTIGTALVGASIRAANFGDAMLTMSQRTGISTEKLGGYKLLAEQSGTSLDTLARGMDTLSKNMLAAATGTEKQAQLFQALGISVKDSAGNMRTASDVMPELAERFQGIEDGSLKAALAGRVFGTSIGPQLVGFLNEGAEGMERAQKRAKDLGIAMSRAETEAGTKFKAALTESKFAVEGLSNSIGVVLLPSLTEAVKEANEWVVTLQKWAKENPGLTEGLAMLSLGLLGSGGVIVGLVGAAAVLPSIVEGMKLIGITSLASFGAAAGAIAFYTAAVGTLLYQAKQAEDYTARVREDPADWMPKNAKEVIGMSSIFGAMGLADAYFNPAAPKTPSKLGPPGLPADWMTQSEFGMGAANKAREEQLRKLLADMERHSKAGKSEAQKEAERIAQEQERIRDAFQSSLRPADEWIEKLAILRESGARDADIVQVYGDQIMKAAQAQREHGFAVDAGLASIAEQAELLKLTSRAFQMEAETLKAIEETTKARKFDPLLLPVDMSMPEGGPLAAGDLRGADIRARMDEATDSLQKQRDEMMLLSDTIVGLSNKNMSATEIEQALGISLEDVAESARELGVEIDPLVKQMAIGEEISRSWGESFARISDSLVDMIVDFDFSFKRLADIGLDTAKSMARSFLDGFFTPFKDGLRGLGQEAGKWASGLIFGAPTNAGGGGGGLLGGILGGGGGGGLLGGILGGGNQGGLLSGIFGGGSAQGGMWPGTPPFVGGHSMTGGGASMGGLSSLMGIGSVLGGAGAAISAVNAVATGGFKPGQKAQDSASAFWKGVYGTMKDIDKNSSLSASEKLEKIRKIADAAMPQVAQLSGVDKNYAKAFSGTGNLLSRAVSDFEAYYGPMAKEEAAAKGIAPGGSGSGGDIILNFNLPDTVTTPEKWIKWFQDNSHGIREVITRGVRLTDSAILST